MNDIAINACLALAEHDQDAAVRMLVALRTQLSAQVESTGAAFTEARTAFADPLSITVPDPAHSSTESRWILVGRSQRGRWIGRVDLPDQGRLVVFVGEQARRVREEEQRIGRHLPGQAERQLVAIDVDRPSLIDR